jgi:tripartite-type tricarboxylate transporter receptor subunit TctC
MSLKPRSVLLALIAGLAAQPGFAQDYPSRPITLIVPYAAGGGNDLMARTAAEKMSKTLGQQIVIENRGGAGGSIATRQIAKATADGYTLGLGGTGTLAINPRSTPTWAMTRAGTSRRSASSPPARSWSAYTRRCLRAPLVI